MNFLSSFIIFTFIVISGFLNAQIIDKNIVSIELSDVPFQTLIEKLEKEYNFHFYYRQEWIDNLQRVTIDEDSIEITSLLNKVLRFSNYDFVIIDEQDVYIIPTKSFISELPDYSTKNKEMELESATYEGQSDKHETYLKGREPDMIATIVVGSKNNKRTGRYNLISARIFDKKTGEPIIGATLYIRELKKGAATDINGVLNLALMPGKYTAEFQSIGMMEVKCILDIQSDGHFVFPMEEKITSLDEVVINAGESNQRNARIGLEKISIKSVKEIPAFMGEKDVIKISQMLPGVVSVSEGSSGLNVRGGNSDQNIFYLNAIPLYNTSHLFGFFSAINSSIINNFSLYKSYVPAEYGGRLSSVFTMDTKKPNKNKMFMQGGISPISANLEIEGPLIKNKCSAMLSVRSTYSDWILNRLQDPALRNSSAQFYDFTGSIEYDFNDKNKISAYGYYSYDYFDYNKSTNYNYSNTGASINYFHRFNNSIKVNTSLVNSKYKYGIIENTVPTEAYNQDYSLNHLELKSVFDWSIKNKHFVNFGFDLINYNLDRGVVEPYGTESIKKDVELGKEQGLESSIFIEDKYQLKPWLVLTGAFRYSFYSAYGPKTVYHYYPNSSIESKNISDTIEYGSNEIITSYNNPQFRLAADFKINTFNSFKLSFNQMQQYLFILSNTISLAPNDQWKLVDYHIKPSTSNQISVGYYKIFPAIGINTSIESYYKQLKQVPEYKDGVDFLNTTNIETTLLQGKQDAYGLELMVAKEEGDFTGWATYTYSRSIITVNGTNSWDKINNGNPYPSNYDKPHVCNLILTYHFNRRFSVSSNTVYATGRPITLPQGYYYIQGKPYVDYSARNEYRIPDYFRIDLSATLEGNLRFKKAFHSYWVFSIYNLTGRNNAQSVYFKSENGKINGYKYSVIGEPIFTVSWNFKLGNFNNN